MVFRGVAARIPKLKLGENEKGRHTYSAARCTEHGSYLDEVSTVTR